MDLLPAETAERPESEACVGTRAVESTGIVRFRPMPVYLYFKEPNVSRPLTHPETR